MEVLWLVDTRHPFGYSRWRHGGWYVIGIRDPNGACGCVSNKYLDKKWRIACDDRKLAPTKRMVRALCGAISMAPLAIRASRCLAAALGLAQPKAAINSEMVGGRPVAAMC